MHAAFAIPGALETPTGGYAYARRVLLTASDAGLRLDHVALPGGFPRPDAAALRRAGEILAAVPETVPILVDGLAYGALPKALVRAIRAPIVALCHHPLALETGLAPGVARCLRATETLALAEARRVVVTSRATAAILTDRFGVPSARIAVAPPGVDPAPRASVGARRAGSGCRILSVGSITPRKGHLALIEALDALTDLDWRLRIVGPKDDRKTCAALEARIASLGLGDRVDLVGALDATAVAAEYRSADLFVLASTYEGFGMAFAEAMAHGLPTVGLRSPAVEEATAGAACLVVPGNLGPTLRRLIADPTARRVLADECWAAAQAFPRWPWTVAILADVLKAAAQ